MIDSPSGSIAAAFIGVFVLLHRADGQEVAVSPQHITSLRSTPGSLSKQFSHEVRCLVGLDDGKFVSVIETCSAVKRLLEDAK